MTLSGSYSSPQGGYSHIFPIQGHSAQQGIIFRVLQGRRRKWLLLLSSPLNHIILCAFFEISGTQTHVQFLSLFLRQGRKTSTFASWTGSGFCWVGQIPQPKFLLSTPILPTPPRSFQKTLGSMYSMTPLSIGCHHNNYYAGHCHKKTVPVMGIFQFKKGLWQQDLLHLVTVLLNNS